ncbi:peroxiredoxin family protein [Thalassotalea crassostreae]|uniref:peroxiredoxin family protein n=1 Tax=Thalassotalea crassostreae TaxID=1763536 RepID=UPI000837C870|nr:peroxiredoxin family protein [Thalassotalea crassostreae]
MKTVQLICSTILLLITSTAAVAAKPIAESAEVVSPLLPGQKVPSVQATDLNNKPVDLAQIVNGKPTVLFFYRGGWCPFCNTQMGQLQAIEKDLKDLGFQLIGISTDNIADLNKSISDRELSYQLLSDYNSQVSQAFGLAFFTSQKVTDRYLAKMDLKNPLQKNAAGVERLVLPAPAVYVIDSKGLVQFQYVNPNFRTRLAPELLLHAAKLAK